MNKNKDTNVYDVFFSWCVSGINALSDDEARDIATAELERMLQEGEIIPTPKDMMIRVRNISGLDAQAGMG